MRGPQSGERGAVLLLVLILTTLAVIIATEVRTISSVNRRVARRLHTETQLEAAVTAGLTLARATLAQDLTDSEVDSTLDQWAQPIEYTIEDPESETLGVPADGGEAASGDGGPSKNAIRVRIEIVDEDRKYPLHLHIFDTAQTKEKRIRALANVLDMFRDGTVGDLPGGDAERLARAIVSFVLRKPEDEYGGIPKPPTKKEGLVSVGELALCPDVDDSLIYDQWTEQGSFLPGLYRFVTVWSDLRVNVNTAELPVLMGIFDPEDARVGEEIYRFRLESEAEENERREREGSPFDPENRAAAAQPPPGQTPTGGEEEEAMGAVFTQVQDVRQKVEGMSERLFTLYRNILTVSSNTFSVYVSAEKGSAEDGTRVRLERVYVLRRDQNAFRTLFTEPVEHPRLASKTEEERAADLEGLDPGLPR